MLPKNRQLAVSFSILVSFALAAPACGNSTEEEPSPSSAPRSEAPQHPLNPYTSERGDTEAAYKKAQTRFQSLLSIDLGGLLGTSTTDGTTATKGTLVLYDTTGEWGWLGELYATNIGSLVSHFGTWTAKPAASYTAGELGSYSGLVYVGSTFDEQLPAALLDDVLSGARPVVWIDDNIWQLAARDPSFSTNYGFMPWVFDFNPVNRVDYKATALTRYDANGAGIMTYSSLTTGTVLAQAAHTSDGSQIPWAVRGKNLTYIGENPLAYVTSNDRYLAFCDLLFDAFAPTTQERHRALVRIEDVSPMTEPNRLTAIADYLASQAVPFSIALIPYYRDPLGVENGGVPRNVHLAQRPGLVKALNYMRSKGGTIIMHGYTHQYDSTPNPYNAVSADDFEFYRTHIDANNFVIYDGPLPGDSQSWADGRITSGLTEISGVLLPAPTIFEFPHYAGSVPDNLAVRAHFATAYHRGLYFSGQLSGQTPNYTRPIGVVYPYVGTDIYGFKIVPETMGSYEPEASNNNPPRLVPDLLTTAKANYAIRDGFASFYFHPYYPIDALKQIVAGVKAAGYTFVSATSL
jgi:uncharacterized protein YdaL